MNNHRYHQWGFIVNEAGEPIKDAEITVYEAGSEIPAKLYYDEFGTSNSINFPDKANGPQLSTLSNGYYEFWIGDVTETHGYRNDQKFKLTWVRVGVASGEIDYINVFPLGPQTEGMSLTDCVSPTEDKNKLISDYYACKWDSHVDFEVVDGDETAFYPVHGLDFVNVEDMDGVKNKIINNYLGWHWDHHRLSTVQDFHPSAGSPHNMAEVDPLEGSSILRNKLVSNRDLYYIHTRITDLSVYVDTHDTILQNQIDSLYVLSDLSQSGWYTVYVEDWIEGTNNQWYVDILHNLDIWYPMIMVWDMGTNKAIQVAELEFVTNNIVKITVDNDNYPGVINKQLAVRIANGGIQRHP